MLTALGEKEVGMSREAQHRLRNCGPGGSDLCEMLSQVYWTLKYPGEPETSLDKMSRIRNPLVKVRDSELYYSYIPACTASRPVWSGNRNDTEFYS